LGIGSYRFLKDIGVQKTTVNFRGQYFFANQSNKALAAIDFN